MGSFELSAARSNPERRQGDCRRGHRQLNGRDISLPEAARRNAFRGVVIDECKFPGKTFPWRQ